MPPPLLPTLTRLTSPWSTPPHPPPPRSADLFLILFVSIFLFITAGLLRLIPWLTPLDSQRHAESLRALRAYAPYGALDDRTERHPSYETLLEMGDRIGVAKRGLSDEQIEILPTHACTNSETVCAICRDTVHVDELICVLPCADEFHAECIRPWLKLQATCPLCRSRFA